MICKEWYTANELAKAIGRGRDFIEAASRREEDPLPCIKIGSITQYRLTDYNEWAVRNFA